MIKKIVISIILLVVTTLSFANETLNTQNMTQTQLYDQLVSLHLGRNGYTLGAHLTPKQQETAASHRVEGATPGTYKFIDANLAVVVDATTHRVMVLFEKFDNISSQAIQDLVGSLFMEYDEPTTSAHDKIVYWAYDTKGKISSQRFDKAKKKNLDILATVKLNSSLEVLGREPTTDKGDVYYIISSPPLLEQFQQD